MAASIRSKMVAQAEWAIAHEPSFHYAEIRPIPYDAFKAHKLPLTTDCSGFVSCIAFAVGAPDPNGQGYNGQGFTGTLLQHLDHIEKRNALPGDFIAYGPFPGEHVTMLLEAGSVPDPWLVSHGQEAGPIKIRASVEAKAHHTQVTYLRSVPVGLSHVTVWDIRDGRNEHLATVKHPALYAARHPRMFRRYGMVSFHRRNIPG